MVAPVAVVVEDQEVQDNSYRHASNYFISTDSSVSFSDGTWPD